jgi:hypothetical protein
MLCVCLSLCLALYYTNARVLAYAHAHANAYVCGLQGPSLGCTYLLPHLSAISHPLLFPISPTYLTFHRLIVTH